VQGKTMKKIGKKKIRQYRCSMTYQSVGSLFRLNLSFRLLGWGLKGHPKTSYNFYGW
jgi:hypothetical protein